MQKNRFWKGQNGGERLKGWEKNVNSEQKRGVEVATGLFDDLQKKTTTTNQG